MKHVLDLRELSGERLNGGSSSEENLGGADVGVMHDMPVHPGSEISEELTQDPRSIIYDQAENRLYSARALLLHALGQERARR